VKNKEAGDKDGMQWRGKEEDNREREEYLVAKYGRR